MTPPWVVAREGCTHVLVHVLRVLDGEWFEYSVEVYASSLQSAQADAETLSRAFPERTYFILENQRGVTLGSLKTIQTIGPTM